MVGRITAQKAPDIFVKAAKLIKKQVPGAYFIIVGDGEQKGEIERYAKENGFLDSLLITGWVEDAMDYIEMFDVAMLLSRWEGFGLVLPEYMMAGKPIVATRVDAIPDIIEDGENGLLVEADDPEAVCKAVERLYEDLQLKINLANRGMMAVRGKYDAKRVSREHGDMFRQAMHK